MLTQCANTLPHNLPKKCCISAQCAQGSSKHTHFITPHNLSQPTPVQCTLPPLKYVLTQCAKKFYTPCQKADCTIKPFAHHQHHPFLPSVHEFPTPSELSLLCSTNLFLRKQPNIWHFSLSTHISSHRTIFHCQTLSSVPSQP